MITHTRSLRIVLSLSAMSILVAALLLGGVLPSGAQTTAVKAKPSFATTPGKGAQQTFPAPPAGPQEKIKVHGHWTIEVRNPDGMLVTRREFENSLATGGDGVLNGLLTRAKSAGEWSIILFGLVCGQNKGCELVEPGSALPSPNSPYSFAPTLNVSVPTSGQYANMLVLQGNATVSSVSQLTVVNTFVLGCPASSAPATPCAFGSPGSAFLPFTLHTLPSPVSVQAGQIITITVAISFS